MKDGRVDIVLDNGQSISRIPAERGGDIAGEKVLMVS